MNLHEHLRDLVAHQGPSVVDTAEAFRAALDDFLSEDEATTGELNLLVDAVRLGAVDRLGSILDHGGSAPAAVSEAGDGFARDRGTDDLPRCRWAVAVVGYAPRAGSRRPTYRPPGRRASRSRPATSPTTPPSPPPPRESERPAPRTGYRAHTPHLPLHRGPGAQADLRHTGSAASWRARVALVALLVAAIVVAAVFAGMWLGSTGRRPERLRRRPHGRATGGWRLAGTTPRARRPRPGRASRGDDSGPGDRRGRRHEDLRDQQRVPARRRR